MWLKASAGLAIAALILTFPGAGLFGVAHASDPDVIGTVTTTAGSVVPGVNVQLHTPDGNASWTATTAADGTYSFDVALVSGTNYVVEITAPEGYNRYNQQGIDNNFQYQTGDATRTINFAVVRASKTVSGTVTDASGSIITDADLILTAYNIPSATTVGTHTDNNGAYSVNVVGGTWFVEAAVNLSDTNFTQRWINEQPPVRIDFKADESTETATQNFQVTPASGKVTVQLLNSDGSKLTTSDFVADIDFRRADGVGTRRKVRSSDSVVSVFLTPGIYSITAFHNDLRGKSFDPEKTTFVMTENGDIDLGTIQAEVNSAHLKGTVLVDSVPVQNANIEALREGGSERIQGNADQQGAFDLVVGAGTWIIGQRSDQGNSQYQQITQALATVKNGETASGLTVSVKVVDRTISGSVVNSSGSKVTDFVGSAYVRTTKNTARISAPVVNGDFSIRYASAEVAGSKVVLGVQAAPGSSYAGGNEVQISHTAVRNITLRPYDATLLGSLVLGDGTSVANAGSDIQIIAADDDGNFTSANAKSDGSFTLPLAAGTWLVDYEILHPEDTDHLLNRPSAQTTITVKAGATVAKNLVVLKGTNTITGTVTDADGAVVKRAVVTIDNRPSLDSNVKANPNDLITLNVETDEDGVYAAVVPNGTYFLTVGNTPAVSDDQLPPDGKSAKVTGKTTATVNLTFKDTDALISGKVRLGKTSEGGGTITAYSDDGSQQTTNVSADGSYSLNVTSKDKWHIVATDLQGKNLLESDTVDVTPKKGGNAVNLTLKDSGIDVPGPVTKTFNADEGGNVSLPDGTNVNVPAFALGVTGTVSVTVTPTVDLDQTSSDQPASLAYVVKATDPDGHEIKKLNKDMTVSVPYSQSALESNGINEKNVATKFFNDQTQTWEATGVAGVADKTGNVATFTTNHLTKFSVTGIGAKPLKATKLSVKSYKVTSAVIEVTGQNFKGKASAKIGSVASSKATVSKNGKTLTLTFKKKLKTGSYDLVITNGNARTLTLAKAVTVTKNNLSLKLK